MSCPHVIKGKGMWVSICAILSGEVGAGEAEDSELPLENIAVFLLGLKTKQQAKAPCAGPNQTFLQGGFGLEATC